MTNPIIQIEVRGDRKGKQRILSDLRDIGKVADGVNKRTSTLFQGAGKSAQGVRQLASANKEFNQASRSAAQSADVFQKQLIRQEKAVRTTRNQVVTLNSRLRELGGGQSQAAVRRLSQEFRRFHGEMRGGARTREEFNRSQLRMKDAIARARREAQKFSKDAAKKGRQEIDKWKLAVEDLTKSVQVALGPLSGVAARITALSALFNKNNAIIAGSIGGMIGFGAALSKVVMAGSRAERDMLRFNALLESTGRQAQTTSEELNQMARDFGKETLGAATQAREALSFLLAAEIPVSNFREVLDISQGLTTVQGDLISNVRLLVRALAEPGEALSRLSRRTRAFNEEAIEQIKLMKETGDVAGATAEILNRLANFQTLALEEGRGLAGQFDRLTENLTMFLEEAATAENVTGGVSSALSEVNDEIEVIISNQEIMSGVSKTFATAVRGAGSAVKFLVGNLETLASVIGLLIGGKLILAVVSVLSRAATAATAAAVSFRTLSGVAVGLGAALKSLMKGFLGPIGLAWGLYEALKAVGIIGNETKSDLELIDEVSRAAGEGQKTLKGSIEETTEAIEEQTKARKNDIAIRIEEQRIRAEEIKSRLEEARQLRERAERTPEPSGPASGPLGLRRGELQKVTIDAQASAANKHVDELRESLEKANESLERMEEIQNRMASEGDPAAFNDVSANIRELENQLDTLRDKWQEGTKEQRAWRESLVNVDLAIANIDNNIKGIKDSSEANTEEAREAINVLEDLREGYVSVRGAIANANPELEKQRKILQEGNQTVADTVVELTNKKRALQAELGILPRVSKAQEDFNKVLNNLPEAIRNNEEIIQILKDLFDETQKLEKKSKLKEWAKESEESFRELKEELGLLKKEAADLDELESLQDTFEEIAGFRMPEGLAQSFKDLANTEGFDAVSTELSNLLDSFAAGDIDPQTFKRSLNELSKIAREGANEVGNVWEDVFKEVGAIAAQALGDAIIDEVGGEGFGAKLGQQIGGTIGAAIGGPIGQIIGETIGNVIGDFFDDLFGSDNPGVQTFNIQASQPSFSDLDQSRDTPFGGVSSGNVWNTTREEIERLLDQLVDFDRRLATIFDPSDYDAITAALMNFNETFEDTAANVEEVMRRRFIAALRAARPEISAFVESFSELEDMIAVFKSLMFLMEDFSDQIDRMVRSLGASEFTQAAIDIESLNDKIDDQREALQQAIASGDPRVIQQAAEELSQSIVRRYEMEEELVNSLVDRIEELGEKIRELRIEIAEVTLAQQQWNLEIDQLIAEMTGGDVTGILRENLGALRQQVMTLQEIEGAGDQVLSTLEEFVSAVDQWLQSAIADAQAAAQDQLNALAQEREEIMQRGRERAQARQRASQAAAQAARARNKALQDALKKQIDLLESWQKLAEDLEQTIADMRLSQVNPLSATARFTLAGQRVAELRQEFQGASGEDRVDAARRLVDAIQARLELGQEIFQRPSGRFQDLFNESITELTDLKKIAEKEAEDLPALQKQLNDLQGQTVGAIRSGNNQAVVLSGKEQRRLEEIKEEEERIKEALEAKIEELREEAAEQYEWARGEGNGVYDTQLQDLRLDVQATTAELLQARITLNGILGEFDNPQNYLNARLREARDSLHRIEGIVQTFLNSIIGAVGGNGGTGTGAGGGGGGGGSGPVIDFPPEIPVVGGGFHQGGSFVVGGNSGIDKNLVSFRATRGERVDITPANQPIQPIVIEDNRVLQFNNVTKEDAEYIKRVLRQDAEENAAFYERQFKKVRRNAS